MKAEAKDAFGDEARAGPVSPVKEDTHLAKLGGSHSEMVEIVLNVVVGAVERGLPARGSSTQDGHVAHDVLECRLHLRWPLGRPTASIGRRNRVVPRQAAPTQPLQERCPMVGDKVLGHVVDSRSLVEG